MEIRNRQELKTASIRLRTPVANLSQELGRAYGEIMGSIGKQGIQPTGAPFAVYHNMDMSDLDVEMGYPVSGTVRAEGRVQASRLPGGRTAVANHHGSYESIGDTYNALTAFIQEKKAKPAGISYEFYLNDPGSTKAEDLDTEINFPLAD